MNLYDNLFKTLNLLTLRNRSHQLDVLFLINVFICIKCCPTRNFNSSLAFLTTSLQLDVFQIKMQCVNLLISLGALV
jgi:hypothetical protein